MRSPVRSLSILKTLVVLAFLIALSVILYQSAQVRKAYQVLAAVTPAPSAAPPPLSYRAQAPLFRVGSIGPEVISLQRRLSDLGYYSGEADGKYYEGTASAVRTFQLQNGLDADGIAGEMTLRLLDSQEAKPFDPHFATPSPAP